MPLGTLFYLLLSWPHKRSECEFHLRRWCGSISWKRSTKISWTTLFKREIWQKKLKGRSCTSRWQCRSNCCYSRSCTGRCSRSHRTWLRAWSGDRSWSCRSRGSCWSDRKPAEELPRLRTWRTPFEGFICGWGSAFSSITRRSFVPHPDRYEKLIHVTSCL